MRRLLRAIAYVLAFLGCAGARGAVNCNIPAGASSATIQAAINAMQTGSCTGTSAVVAGVPASNTVQNALGTYSGTTTLTFPVNTSGNPSAFVGPVSSDPTNTAIVTGKAVFNGPVTGGYGFIFAGGVQNVYFENVEWNGNQPNTCYPGCVSGGNSTATGGGGGGIFITRGASGITILYNYLHGNQGSPNGNASNQLIWFDGYDTGTSGTAAISNVEIGWNQIGSVTPANTSGSGDCSNLMTAINYAGKNYDATTGANPGWCVGIGIHSHVNNVNIHNNRIWNQEQAIKQYDGSGAGPPYYTFLENGLVATANDMQFDHRNPIEWQGRGQGSVGMDLESNDLFNVTGPGNAGLLFSIPSCCGGNSVGGAPAITVPQFTTANNNFIAANSGGEPMGIEFWSQSTANHNLIQGNFTSGSIVGAAINWGFSSTSGGYNWAVNYNTMNITNGGFVSDEESYCCAPSQTGNVQNTTLAQVTSVAPTITPPSGAYASSVTVTITDPGFTGNTPVPTGNTSIYYTTDGTTPVPGAGTTKFYAGPFAQPLSSSGGLVRGRVQNSGGSVLADDGQPIRAVTARLRASEWGPFGSQQSWWQQMHDVGKFNAVRVMSGFSACTPSCSFTAAQIEALLDQGLANASATGMYMIIDDHDECCANQNLATDTLFWNAMAPRYANNTNVIYEAKNEPNYFDTTTNYGASGIGYPGYENAIYGVIRPQAPNTHIIMWTTSQPYDVSQATQLGWYTTASTISYANASVGVHPYNTVGGDGGCTSSTSCAPYIARLAAVQAAGYPVILTELDALQAGAPDQSLLAQLDSIGVSWMWDDFTGVWTTGTGPCSTANVCGNPHNEALNIYWVQDPNSTGAGGTVKAVGLWGARNQPLSYPAGYGFAPSAVQTANYTSTGGVVLTSVTLSNTGSVHSLTTGATIQMNATCNYSDGTSPNCNTTDSHGNSVSSWASDNAAVSISATGLATANSIGSANLTAVVNGQTSPNWAMAVTSTVVTLNSVLLATTGGVTSLAVGGVTQLLATCFYSDGSQPSCGTTDSHGNVVNLWTSSAPTVATASTSGVVTGLAAGGTNLTATVGAPTAAALGNTIFDIPEPDTTNFINATYAVPPAGGGTVDHCTVYIPAATQTNGAFVDCGLLLAPTPTTSATSWLCHATYTNVSTTGPGAFVSLPLTGCGMITSPVWVGTDTNATTSQLGYWDCGGTCNGTAPTSGNGTYDGYYKAATYGTYTGLSATMSPGGNRQLSAYVNFLPAGGVTSNTVPLTVTAGPPTLLSAFLTTPGNVSTLTVGSTLQFAAKCVYSNVPQTDCTVADVYGNAVTIWNTSDPTLATIGAIGSASPGLVTGIAAGAPNLSANIGSVASSLFPLTVTTVPPTITGVSLATTGGVTGLFVGFTNALVATCSYSNGSQAPCTATNYLSTTPAHATVNNTSGLVTAVAPGSTTFTAQAGGFTSMALPLTVLAVPTGVYTITMSGPVSFTGTVKF